MYVLKFGGTSVGSAESIKTIFSIISKRFKKDKKPPIMVVSAFSGITNQLQKLSDLAQQRDPAYQTELEGVRQRHLRMIDELLGTTGPQTEELIMPLLLELAEIIHGMYLLRECSPRTLDFILSFGERLSATIIASYFNHLKLPAVYCDARELIQSDDHFGCAHIDFEESNKRISKYFKTNKEVAVVTGFIASTEDKVTTTMGRGGSDYTAAILAAALNAREIQIWTDVNGVMTTNPNQVPDAFPLPQLTYEEAMELSHFGAKVLHPPTIQPALEKNIPIRILNTFDLSFDGTVISTKKGRIKHPVTGLTAIDNVALLTVEGSGMVGVPGVSARLFQSLANKGINVILITQASSEHSICVAVSPQDARNAKKIIETEFRFEMQAHEIDPVSIESDLSIVAIVGRNMRKTTGISAKVFGALGSHGINVVAIAQGSSELNISVVVPRAMQTAGLNAIHQAFFDAQNGRAHLYIAGSGLIGSELVRQIRALPDSRLLICGITNSRKMALSAKGVDIDGFFDNTCGTEKAHLADFVKSACSDVAARKIFVDCSASNIVSDQYETLLANAVHVVAANKIANSGDGKFYKKLRNTATQKGTRFLYETNVGAGLPVIETLQGLLRSGDKVKKIEGILSGTLSYLFNTFDGSVPFSQVLRKAREFGYTEPDPRVDLGGTDVARKILILARECGFSTELENVKITGFLPEKCVTAKTINGFFAALKKNDTYFGQLLAKARKNGNVLRYIASFNNKKISIGLQEVGATHPFYTLQGADNVIAFYTRRYAKTPLVIKGPGAGAAVTAAGVLTDILKIIK